MNFLKFFGNNPFYKSIRHTQLSKRFLSASKDNDPRITITDDGQTIVCWHPVEPLNYEHTMPFEAYSMNPQSSVLNVETIDKGENIYYKTPMDRLGMEQLQSITYTIKDNWRRRRFDGLQMRPNHPRKGV